MKDRWSVAVLRGDGTGPEVIGAALIVAKAVNRRFGITMRFTEGKAGYNCIRRLGTNLPDATLRLLKKSDCVIKGPMTTPEGQGSETSAAVKIRKAFRLYANVRPAKSLAGVKGIKDQVDMVIVRENTEGMYSGFDVRVNDDTAIGMRLVTREASRKVGRFALDMAARRKKHLTIVHKGNILKETDGLFKESIMEEATDKKYRMVKVDDAHVDAMAQWLIKSPVNYDVIVTENLFGDILSDEAAEIVGGVGVGPSANIGEGYAMFEPVHGSAPKYTGMDKMNPIASILSLKMMYEWMGYEEAGKAILAAVEGAIGDGYRTYDIGGESRCSEVGKAIAVRIANDDPAMSKMPSAR